jgi:cellulose synthase/poly-beta-1,6-N-acetylglucosamine synthase-like glycosyltransferase
VARSAGATVWERQDAERRGKGAALSWALGRLEHERPQTDAMVFVDADCQASPNLVSALAGALRQGADAAQSRYLVSNADESSQAALRAAGFSLKHIVRARGRAGLGLSPGLFGTGMAFVAELMHDSTWSESVTEDTELFLRLIETGRSIAYVEHATVSSPAPLTSRDAEDQQLRWETGNRQLLRARLSRLLYRGLGERNREMLGAAAELALPAQSTIVTGQSGVILIAMLTRRRRLLQVSVATLAGEVVYVAGGLILVGGTASLLKALRHLPRFLILRVRILATVSAGGGARSWDRTKRSSG